MSDKGAPDCVSEAMSCSRWAGGPNPVRGGAVGQEERELVEMTGSLDQLAGLEEGEEEEEPCCASISH